MRCTKCHTDNDRVLETRVLANGAVLRRRRQCVECDFRFTSYERIEEQPLIVVKKDNRTEKFSREKLRNGITMAVRKRPVSQESVEQLLDTIEEKVQIKIGNSREIPSQYIGKIVIHALREIDEVAYLRFASVYRNFENIEEFLKEITNLSSRIL